MSALSLLTETQCLAEDAAKLFENIERLSTKIRAQTVDKQEPEYVQVTTKKRMNACVATTTYKFTKVDLNKTLDELFNEYVMHGSSRFTNGDHFYGEMAPYGVICDEYATLITHRLLGSLPAEGSWERGNLIEAFKIKFHSMGLCK